MPRPASTVRRLEAATSALASAAVTRMADTLPWFTALPPQERSWIGLVARAGIDAFVEWYRHPDSGHQISADVFGPAPRALTRAVSLQQTVEMVRVTIDVVDSGPGMSPDEARRAFDRFWRGDASRTRSGTGLGLAIVAGIVAAHHGTVSLDSGRDRGTTVTVRLPSA